MEYNTSQPGLIIPEYGRNVQKMVHHLLSIENDEERNRQAQNLIEIIGNLNPQVRDVPDFRHKLWDHLFIMSEFKLDVESPYPKPSEESFKEKPELVPYPKNNRKYRHYDAVILKEMNDLADGQLILDDMNLMAKHDLVKNAPKRQNQHQNKGKGNNRRRKNYKK